MYQNKKHVQSGAHGSSQIAGGTSGVHYPCGPPNVYGTQHSRSYGAANHY